MKTGNNVPAANDSSPRVRVRDDSQLRDIEDLVARLQLVTRQLASPVKPVTAAMPMVSAMPVTPAMPKVSAMPVTPANPMVPAMPVVPARSASTSATGETEGAAD